jgi:glycosyl transferase, family 25
VHAYVINLARSRDRRAYIVSELKKTGLDYEIITAVDGRDLDLRDTSIIDPTFLSRIAIAWTAGSAGAALSHISVYRKIIEAGLNAALVLEDDVILPADLRSLADAVADHLSGAEVALLSVDSPDPCKMSLDGSIPLPSARRLALPIDISQPQSAGAYVITREACERMIKCVPPVRVQADTWWFFYREGVLDRVRCVAPLPVLKNPKFTSTIGSYSLGEGVRGRLVKPLMRHKIPLLHQALTYRRQRIYRQWGRAEFVDVPFIEKPSRFDLADAHRLRTMRRPSSYCRSVTSSGVRR